MFRKIVLGAGLLGAMISTAQAATVTANLGVQITLTAACTVTGGTLNFGTQGVLASNIDNTASLTVTCTNTTPYNVGLDKGTYGTAVNARKMQGGATNTEFVNYALYTDTGRTLNWGNTVGTNTVAGIGNGAAQTHFVYGRVPAQSSGSPGTYNDTVTITVTY